jgi:adenylate kinase
MILLLGVAGSGKSVQGKLIAESLNCEYFSTGEFLRQHVDPEIQKRMLTGALISDDEVISATEDALVNNVHNGEFVLDGFLRTVKQADWLVDEVNQGKLKVTAIINLQASAETIMERLLERNRPDDKIDVIQTRVKEYETAIKPIVSRLSRAGIEVNNVDAGRPIDEVQADIQSILQKSK